MPGMLPTRFVLGDTWSQTDTLADYPASEGWVLHTRLVPDEGSVAQEITGSASGDDHVSTATASVTALWAAGSYSVSQWVTLGSASHTVATGRVVLVPNPRTATTALELRTTAQVALDNVRAALRGKASADVLSYTINGRSLERYSVAELIALQSQLASEVARENRDTARAAGRPDPRKTFVRLARA